MKRLFPVVYLLSCLISAHSFAGSATWRANPISSDWNDPANWSPATVPNGPNDVASFNRSNLFEVSLSDSVALATIRFRGTQNRFKVSVLANQTITLNPPVFPRNQAIANYGAPRPTFVIKGPETSTDSPGTIEVESGLIIGAVQVVTQGSRFPEVGGGLLEFHNYAEPWVGIEITNEAGFANGGTTIFHDNSAVVISNLTNKGDTTDHPGARGGQ